MMKIKHTLTLVAFAAAALTAQAQPAQAAAQQEDAAPQIGEKFRALYPNTRFNSVNKAKVTGLYEVVMGDNVAYTDDGGRYFIFGHLFDMKEQVDITAQRRVESKQVEFPSQFLSNAIKTVKGDGSRVVAVFSDPDCPYCKKLEGELARLDNVTVYTFLFPLESLHPEAKTKSIAVWCSPNQQQAWTQAVLTGSVAKLKACDNPVNDNLVLGARLGVTGTPTLIAQDGRILPGAVPAEKLDQWLNTPKATTVGSAP
jgi:thiol:disulfide interchange protein DsbC